MKLQFKEQFFQLQAVKAVVDVFHGQALKSNTFTLERSKELIRKAKEAALGAKGIEFEKFSDCEIIFYDYPQSHHNPKFLWFGDPKSEDLRPKLIQTELQLGFYS